ncbi:MAG: hypothetical protein J6K32_07270 [Clostridia bacterium]|nr:hypothetical protein [Clostridia bacterium]
MSFLEKMDQNMEQADAAKKSPFEEIMRSLERPAGREIIGPVNEKVELLPITELKNIPDCPNAITRGNPFKLSELVDYKQGDAIWTVQGNCGLVSSRNLLALSGKRQVSEAFITKYAIEKNLCANAPFMPASERGGTTKETREVLLRELGLKVQNWESGDPTVDKNRIANALDQGYRGIMSINCGVLWNKPQFLSTTADGRLRSNHVITLLSAVRDGSTGEVKGFFICDSGTGEKCRYVTADLLMKSFNARNAVVQMTTKPMKGVNA